MSWTMAVRLRQAMDDWPRIREENERAWRKGLPFERKRVHRLLEAPSREARVDLFFGERSATKGRADSFEVEIRCAFRLGDASSRLPKYSGKRGSNYCRTRRKRVAPILSSWMRSTGRKVPASGSHRLACERYRTGNVHGCGFLRFRGGAMFWGENRGAAAVQEVANA